MFKIDDLMSGGAALAGPPGRATWLGHLAGRFSCLDDSKLALHAACGNGKAGEPDNSGARLDIPHAVSDRAG